MENTRLLPLHYEEQVLISASPDDVFAFVDDHACFSSHMNQSSWMMGGGSMNVSVDENHDQKVGSHILLSGKAFGIKIFLDEVVTRHNPPFTKTWQTVGTPQLLVVGNYSMSINIEQQEQGSILRISIDYDLPTKNKWLGKLFSKIYAKWCVRQMIKGTQNYFVAQSLEK